MKQSTAQQKIKDAFWELFQKKTIDHITVSELCKLAQINRSTFYAHFKDVYDVLDQIEQKYLPSPEKAAARKFTTDDPYEIFQEFIQAFERNRSYISVLLSERPDTNYVTRLKTSIRPMLKEMLLHVYPNTQTLDITVEYFLSASIGAMTYWFNHDSSLTSEELFLHLHQLSKYGMPHSEMKDVCPHHKPLKS